MSVVLNFLPQDASSIFEFATNIKVSKSPYMAEHICKAWLPGSQPGLIMNCKKKEATTTQQEADDSHQVELAKSTLLPACAAEQYVYLELNLRKGGCFMDNMPGMDMPRSDQNAEAEEPAIGFHRMLIIGEETIYVSHLPMWRRPHNFQVILEVTFRGPDQPQASYIADRKTTGTRLYSCQDHNQIVHLAWVLNFHLRRLTNELGGRLAVVQPGHRSRLLAKTFGSVRALWSTVTNSTKYATAFT